MLLLVLASGLLFGCAGEDLYRLTVGPAVIAVEVADTPQARARGLMFRENLPADQGMLFVFDDSAPRAFYMKNTSIPLSIAYIDERLVVREIYDMEPFSLETVPSRGGVRYALEVNQGAFAAWGVTVGDRVSVSGGLASRIGM